MDYFSYPVKTLEHYRVHILVFLLAFFVALTFAHPAFFYNDGWITGNQLAQLNDGHQAIVNEGKYGTFENGTRMPYFDVRNNYLGYSLFLPLISLPAEWGVTLLGNHFTFFILYLWTFLLICIALVLNAFFPEYTRIGKWRWTTGLIALTFASFFLNLVYYAPFQLTGTEAYPEIMAIVFTNILLFAGLAVIVYEILRLIFHNSPMALFGSIVCLSCSSSFFWTTMCKDHVLVIFLFSIVLLLIIKFLCMDTIWSLAGSFFFAGLLAWARPELGLFIFIALCVVVVAYLVMMKNSGRPGSPVSRPGLIISPFITVLGAIPLFINNYLATYNIFIPAFVLTTNVSSSAVGLTGSSQVSHPYTLETFNLLLQTNQFTVLTSLSSFPADLYGIFLSPQTGSMGILPLIPVFLVAILILPLLIRKNNDLFDHREKMILGTLLLVSLAIFGAYINRISGLNTDLGIMPDIRYLSPIYLPLTIIGLMIFKKVPPITSRPIDLVAGISAAWVVFIPISLVMIVWYYPKPSAWNDLFSPLSHWITLCIFILCLVFIIMYYYSEMITGRGISEKIMRGMFICLCALPLIWQADASFIALLFSHGVGEYLFWIPILLKLFSMIL